MSAEGQTELRKMLAQQQQDLDRRSRPLQQQMQRRGAEEQNKVLDLIQVAIDSEAASGQYDIIMHKEAVAFAAAAESTDISSLVVERVKNMK